MERTPVGKISANAAGATPTKLATRMQTRHSTAIKLGRVGCPLSHMNRGSSKAQSNAALKNLRSFAKGDLALIYHTGEERQAVGIAEITSKAYSDPKQDDEKLVVVDLKPKKKLKRSVTLDEIKKDPTFAGWDLLRIGRLSVVPTPEKKKSRSKWRRVLRSRTALVGLFLVGFWVVMAICAPILPLQSAAAPAPPQPIARGCPARPENWI